MTAGSATLLRRVNPWLELCIPFEEKYAGRQAERVLKHNRGDERIHFQKQPDRRNTPTLAIRHKTILLFFRDRDGDGVVVDFIAAWGIFGNAIHARD